MTAKLTAEQLDALRQQPAGEPLPLSDGQSDKRYFLMDEDMARDFAIYFLGRELDVGIEQLDRGEVGVWDPKRIIADGERNLRSKKPPA